MRPRLPRQQLATRNAQVDPKGPARLIVIGGPSAGAVVPVPHAGSVVVGRASECDLVLAATDISRRHARIRPSPMGGLAVEDLDSSNGTFVNGRPVTQPTPVRFGDQIALGVDSLLLFTHYDSAEEQLLEQQRLELLGRIAAGVAHDLNNLLGAILATKDYLESLPKEQALGAEEVRDCLSDIDIAVNRATDLTPRLLHFVKGSEVRRQRLDSSTICRELAQLARRTFDRRIVVDERIEPDLSIDGDRGQIHQILMNLVVNARDAMPEGGRLTIAARRAEPEELGRRRLKSGRSHIVLTVADTGHGIDAATKERIFEPFFTTKSGKGFGLGLATARQMLAAHQGHIELESELGRGTTFRVYLPAAEGPPSRMTGHDMPAVSAGLERFTILLVDDDECFGKATERLLRQSGHDVERVMSGQDAIVAMDGRNYDVILLDLDMPDTSGEEVLEIIAQQRPRTRVVIMSGHAGGTRMDELRCAYPTLGIVGKPATVDEIEHTIRVAEPLRDVSVSEPTVIESEDTFSSA